MNTSMLTMVSAELFRDSPTSACEKEKPAAPSLGVGNVMEPEDPGSPDGRTLTHVPVFISRMA
jgi:hypothetical protein